MKPLRNGHAILVELIIIIILFSLSSVLVARLFVAAHQLSKQSTASAKLLLTAQSWADQLLTEDEPSAFLQENGWKNEDSGFLLTVDGGMLKVYGFDEEEGLSGRLSTCELSALADNKEIFVFPIVRYKPEEEP